MSATEHRQNKYLNNRCKNSHQPTRQRERAMKGFRSVGAAQRFLASFSRISPHFRPPLHRMAATDHRTEMRGSTSSVGSRHRAGSRCLNIAPCDGALRPKAAVPQTT